MAFLHNARVTFKSEPTPQPVAGTIIAAATVHALDFIKGERARDLAVLKHLQRRILDPQLYLAGLDPAIDEPAVEKLASYPWFYGQNLPEYDSGEYKNPTQWKKRHATSLLKEWTRRVPTQAAAIGKSARGAVQLQKKIGCFVIVLPSPLITIVDQSFERERDWIDAGIEAARDLKIREPLYATVAISEAVLHNVDPFDNPLIHTISNQIASRAELAGAYIVLEQSDPGSYVWKSHDPLLCLMILIDDLCRGAKKDAIINYCGSFGAVATAAGASSWASGYSQKQRRFSLVAKTGRSHPRYYSLALAGDIGVEHDLERIHNHARALATQLMTSTSADAKLRGALFAGHPVDEIPEWQYTLGNTSTAKRHYMEVVSSFGAKLQALSRSARIKEIHRWLGEAQNLASQLAKIGFPGSGPTDIVHQRVWLEVFEKWQRYAKP